MQSIFEASASAAILDRLGKLQPAAPAQWGKMTVSQMLAHCQHPVLVALGDKKLKQSFIGMLFGSIAKKSLLKEKPFPKSLPTAPEFLVKDERRFNEEKQKLQQLVQRLATTDTSSLAAIPHPFFGKMTAAEWGQLNWKHLDHHLKQFGA